MIREHRVDTLEILSTSDLETVVRRGNRRLPVRPYVYRQDITIANSIFHRELIKVLISLNFLIDSICFFVISFNHSSKPRGHFVEYLVGIVAKANIDPLPILDLTDCVQELRRSGIALPDRGPW